MPNSMRIRPVTAELFHADGRTDGQTNMKMLRVDLRNFANAPKQALYLCLKLKNQIVPRSKHSPPESHTKRK